MNANAAQKHRLAVQQNLSAPRLNGAKPKQIFNRIFAGHHLHARVLGFPLGKQGFQRAGGDEKLQAFGAVVLDLMQSAADLAESTDYSVLA